MTYSSAASPPTRRDPAVRVIALIQWVRAHLARLRQPAQLDRLSDHQLKDAGLIRGDIDWLRSAGCSRDAADQLALRAGVRAGNW
jgi:uncharacterized protein YjiS (DUF1127 family)